MSYYDSDYSENTSPHAKAWKDRTGKPVARDWATPCWRGERRSAILQIRIEPSLKQALVEEAERRKPRHRRKASVSDVARDFCIAGLMRGRDDD